MFEPNQDDYMLFYRNIRSDEFGKIDSNTWIDGHHKRFRIQLFSSNNPIHNENISGYYLCQRKDTFELVSSRYIDGNLNEICQNDNIYNPRSEIELDLAMQQAEKSLLNRDLPKLRIFTDYKRLNESHFWSETVQDWWNLKNESQSWVEQNLQCNVKVRRKGESEIYSFVLIL